MKLSLERLLLIYSCTVSTALAAAMLMGAHSSRVTAFDEIEVHRINVVEPNGTLRLVLANKDRLPPVIVRGQARPEMGEARPQAGMLFYNDEGTENGGLIFGGRRTASGEVVDSGGSLSFDKYGAGQVVQLAGVDDKDARFAGLAVSGDHGQRVWVGRDQDGQARVSLAGADGKPRIRMEVTADGSASLAFLDADGKVVRELTPRP